MTGMVGWRTAALRHFRVSSNCLFQFRELRQPYRNFTEFASSASLAAKRVVDAGQPFETLPEVLPTLETLLPTMAMRSMHSRFSQMQRIRHTASRFSGRLQNASAMAASCLDFSGTNVRSVASGPRGEQMRSPLSRLAVDGVENIIAVASGKGGVGKSTTAVNLAVALALECKLRVGLLDADVYGPSIPTLMNLEGRPQLDTESRMLPLENFGVRCMSMGFLMDKDAPAVWRGPMVMSALEKLMRGTAWGKIDVMVVDMPPGTGDAQISISQRLPLAGAVIVSTPQDLALVDARRGVTMFQKVDVPILGLIENMSFFKCPKCGEATNVFGHGGARLTAKEMNMEFLGEVPLNMSIRTNSDLGTPIVVSSPDSEIAILYKTVARRIQCILKEIASSEDSAGPKFVIK